MRSILIAMSLFVFSCTAAVASPMQGYTHQVESFALMDSLHTNDGCASCEMEADLFHVGIDGNIASHGAGDGHIVSETYPETITASASSDSTVFHLEDPGLRS